VIYGTFAIAALLLAAVGLYGVISGRVAERTREIGIRTALGARPAQVLRLVAAQGLLPVVIGLAAGGAISLLAGRALAGLLYGVTPSDPTTYSAVALGVIVVALLACWSPAARAVRADPTRTLRAD
jgi:ABC-type antimicrobial peptide transport system permease subunit